MHSSALVAAAGFDPTDPTTCGGTPAAGAAGASAHTFASGGGYRAIDDSERRRRPSVVRSVAEDRVLKDRQRQRLAATHRDVYRNFAVLAWMVNKHLDYVSRFRFRATTPDEGFNREYEAWHRERTRPEAFDLAGRHNQAMAIRLLECHAVLEGDSQWLKYAAGRVRGLVELTEGDRVRNEGRPEGVRRDGQTWVNGVRIDPRTGRALQYAVANRTDSGFAPGRVVSARNVITRGYYQRYDQVRGISPIASACNAAKDTDESFDFARAKVKLAQMMGIKFSRSNEGPVAEYIQRQRAAAAETEGVNPDDTDEARYEVNLDGGMFALDLDREDDAELMESRTPAAETVAFLKLQIHVTLRALDIPYSFWDESFTNFYGQRGSFLSYLQSAEVKRASNIEVLDRWQAWASGLAVADRSLVLPSRWDYDDLSHEYVPIGQPWWDPAKETTAALMQINAGLTSPQRVCRENDTDFEKNIDDIAAATKYAESKGVTLSFGASATEKSALADDAGAGDRNADNEPEDELSDGLEDGLEDDTDTDPSEGRA